MDGSGEMLVRYSSNESSASNGGAGAIFSSVGTGHTQSSPSVVAVIGLYSPQPFFLPTTTSRTAAVASMDGPAEEAPNATVDDWYRDFHHHQQRHHEYATWVVLAEVTIAVSCALIAAGTVVGNVLVCMAVAIVRKLQTPSNLLIVSLAVSDLLVAVLVMPLAAVYEVLGRWPFGRMICDAWTSLDVLLCTASILNLCTISVDRYLVITRPLQYAVRRTPGRMALMAAGVWVSAALISVPPQLFGWRSDSSTGNDDSDGCLISQDLGYQIYATVGAFYLPLGVMAFIYYRIYRVSARIVEAEARSQQLAQPQPGVGVTGPRSRRSTSAESSASIQKPMANYCGGVTSSMTSSVAESRQRSSRCAARLRRIFVCVSSADRDSSALEIDQKPRPSQQQRDSIALKLLLNDGAGVVDGYDGHGVKKKRFRFMTSSSLNRISSSRERKATKTLGVIMGCFTVCWLPFFIVALVKSFTCTDSECVVPHWLEGIFLWLGYANSLLNPVIYARFNRDFRTPFRQILACRCRGINSRMRSESYADQYGALLPMGGGGGGGGCTDGFHSAAAVPAGGGSGGAGRNNSRCSRLSIDTVVHYQSCNNRQSSTVGILKPSRSEQTGNSDDRLPGRLPRREISDEAV